MQSIVQIFVKRTANRTEKKIRSFSERTMRSKRENDVQRVQ